MLSQEDHFVLSRTIGGIQEQVRRYNGYMQSDAFHELEGFLVGLRDVVNELTGKESKCYVCGNVATYEESICHNCWGTAKVNYEEEKFNTKDGK